jgi:hypothetical protein
MGEKLRGGRGAPGAMQGEGIARRSVLRQRRISGDDLRRADDVKARSHQRRHVQCLADVAGRIGPIRMLVEECAARRKIEQRSTSQHRQSAVYSRPSENRSPRMHRVTLHLSTLDGRATRLVAALVQMVTRKLQSIPIPSRFRAHVPNRLFQISLHDIDQLLRRCRLRGILGPVLVQHVEPDVPLNQFGHQSI